MSGDQVAWMALVVSFVAAFFTALQWASAYRSANEAKRSANAAEKSAAAAEKQVTEAEKARLLQAEALQNQTEDTKRALEIARQNAGAADRLAEANEALAIAGQRGWLVIAEASASPQHTENKVIIRAHFLIKNVGKTSLTNIALRYCRKVLAEDPKDFAGMETQVYATLAPNSEKSLHVIYEAQPAEFSAIKTGDVKLYFYGNAAYKDIFGYQRTLYWRWEFNGDELMPSREGNELKASNE
jgi:hypothetical protein